MTVILDRSTGTLTAVTVPAATGFRRKALGVSAIAGAVIAAAGFATTVWEDGDQKIDYLDSLVVNPTQSQIAAVLLHFGYMAFGAVLLILAAMTRRYRSRMLTVALGFGGVGAMSLPGFLVTDFYDLAIRQTLPDDLAVQTSDKAESYGIGAIMMAPTLLGILVGLVAGMVVAVRAGFLHWAVIPVFLVGFLFPPFVSDQGWFMNVVPVSIALAALATVGVQALRMSDTEFATGVRV